MRDIHIVMGATGEYGDYTEWPVIAYFDREKANERARLAQEKANEIFKELKGKYYLLEGGENPYDEQMAMDYTGSFYDVITIKLVDW